MGVFLAILLVLLIVGLFALAIRRMPTTKEQRAWDELERQRREDDQQQREAAASSHDD